MTVREIIRSHEIPGLELMAEVFTCDKCGGQTFYIFAIDGQNHSHFQCSNCGISYCPDAKCSVPAQGS